MCSRPAYVGRSGVRCPRLPCNADASVRLLLVRHSPRVPLQHEFRCCIGSAEGGPAAPPLRVPQTPPEGVLMAVWVVALAELSVWCGTASVAWWMVALFVLTWNLVDAAKGRHIRAFMGRLFYELLSARKGAHL